MKTDLMGWTPLDLIKNVSKTMLNPVSSIPAAAASAAIRTVSTPVLKTVVETAAKPALQVIPAVTKGVVSVPKILTTELNPIDPIKFSVPKSITPPPAPTVTTETVVDETEEKTPVQELVSLLPLGGLALFAFAL